MLPVFTGVLYVCCVTFTQNVNGNYHVEMMTNNKANDNILFIMFRWHADDVTADADDSPASKKNRNCYH